LDVTGHYARPDIFTLHVNQRSQTPVVFEKQGSEKMVQQVRRTPVCQPPWLNGLCSLEK
jgi:hypothetical protein